VDRLDELRRWGLAILLVEYPGYGRSSGVPSEEGIRAAMVEAYDLLLTLPGIDASAILGFGQSLGGGAILTLAKERPLGALMLMSTFSSLEPFAHDYFMPAFLLRDRFDNAAALAEFPGQVLLMHGTEDTLIAPDHAQRLFAVRPDADMRWYRCGHWCWLPEQLPIYADMQRFLQPLGILSEKKPQAQ